MHREELNQISGVIIDAAMKVHSALGPGLLESAYEGCLKHELSQRGVKVVSQVVMPVEYDGVLINVGYKLDLLVEDLVVVELKAVAKVLPVHEAQLLSYYEAWNKEICCLVVSVSLCALCGERLF